MSKPLFKTTIEIWSAFDPSSVEIDALAAEAMEGQAYCTKQESVAVAAEEVARVAAGQDGLMDFFGIDPDPEAVMAALASGSQPRVAATFATDDGEHTFTFDATGFFENATDADLIELRDTGWSGDYPADNVAYALEGTLTSLRDALAYTGAHDVGFTVTVDAAQGDAWIAANRPHLTVADAAEGDRS